jgi:hypothetical protein
VPERLVLNLKGDTKSTAWILSNGRKIEDTDTIESLTADALVTTSDNQKTKLEMKRIKK